MSELDSAAPVLELVDLVKHFGSGPQAVRAVDGVSLTLVPGEVLGLVGESGSGKTTLGRCAVRLETVTAGQVLVGGVDIGPMRRRQVRRMRRFFNIVFQDPSSSLNPRMSVADIVTEPLRLHHIGTAATRRDRLSELLDQVGLRPEVGTRYPHELSGGQRQRVSLARALSAGPALLVADEPTSALDVSVQASVLNLIARLQAELRFACLFITHDLAAVEFLAQRIAVMYLGRLVEVSDRASLFAAPRHPYTQALLSAAPIPDPPVQRKRARIILGGDVPSPVRPPSGCRFHTRCPVAEDRCRTDVPPLRPVGSNGSLVACHLVSEDGTGPRLVEPSR
ncbi:ABC transporter ATP-binding protein [Actinocrispum wychmicini]|uniref:Peptide/nickel transport system ATP-binding protein/oligopeptide transport system ATP-binding protein n=1 Tax=Actinocrispum wychmicini TaxID=1213861 RepID=A0A4R2J8A8_9PSEU|nr:oligopeptide/dipeptide ABC transporter ATP-binding protein [Actinocrispum wychmicini]TCO54844.1 peptide/nickel transport system ATP-binding protein/oligopeptide transport system ATP-binding protein [Actinocrispum wychmicini]